MRSVVKEAKHKGVCIQSNRGISLVYGKWSNAIIEKNANYVLRSFQDDILFSSTDPPTDQEVCS